MIRKQIYLESHQNDKVKLVSARQGKTEAEVIREAIDQYMTGESKPIEDPLSQLIGMIHTEDRDGSTTHDSTIYKLEKERP
jgi:hypothetical protein